MEGWLRLGNGLRLTRIKIVELVILVWRVWLGLAFLKRLNL